MKTKITVAEAEKCIARAMPAFPQIEVQLESANGKILREDIFADRDFPPYDRAMMDGIAIAHAAFASGRRNFSIEGIAAAGARAKKLRSLESGCLQIMTGAELPRGCDCVIPIELVEMRDGFAVLSKNL